MKENILELQTIDNTNINNGIYTIDTLNANGTLISKARFEFNLYNKESIEIEIIDKNIDDKLVLAYKAERLNIEFLNQLQYT